MNELISLEKIDAVQLFTNKKLDPLLEAITKKADEFNADVTTQKGRNEITSMAYKVARSKTFIEDAGKELISNWVKKTSLVRGEMKRSREYLDSLKIKVRGPLTEYEDREKKRIEKHEANIYRLEKLMGEASPLASLQVLEITLKILKEVVIDSSWEEYMAKGVAIKEKVASDLNHLITVKKKHEKEQEELRVFREKEAERKKKKYDEAIKKEAAEQARLEAEGIAQREAEEREILRLMAIREKEAVEKRLVVVERAAKEEGKRIAEKAKAEAREALKRAQYEKEFAIKQERERAERERVNAEKKEKERLTAIDAENKKREANKKHRAKIEKNILDDITRYDISQIRAKLFADVLIKGKIRHIKIEY